MHVDAEPLADHAARIEDAAAVVDREADRDRMDDLAIRRVAHRIAAFEHLAHIGVADLAPADGDLGLDDARGAIAARQVDDGAVDLLAGHLLGGMHRAADRGAGGLKIDDRAAAHAARDLLADAEDARLVLDPRDKAADLRRADIDRRDRCCRAAAPVPDAASDAPGAASAALAGLAVRGRAVQGRRGTVLRGDVLHVFFPGERGFAGAASFAAAGARGAR